MQVFRAKIEKVRKLLYTIVSEPCKKKVREKGLSKVKLYKPIRPIVSPNNYKHVKASHEF